MDMTHKNTVTNALKNALIAAAFVLALPGGPALADDDCFVPMADWQPRSAVAERAKQNGWRVRRIKIDDGCYEIHGRDENGRRIEVKLHPATLDVIEMEYESGTHD